VSKQRTTSDAPSAAKPIGRRPGTDSSRTDLIAAARKLFAELGYDKASVRAIAREADVDPALVYHFFGSKEGLLKASLALPVEPDLILSSMDGHEGDEGSALLRTVLQAWSVPLLREQFVAMLRAGISHEHARETLRDVLTNQLLARLADRLPAPDAEFRSGLVASQIAGLAMTRFVIGVDPITKASDEQLIAAVGPTLTRYLSGDLSGPSAQPKAQHKTAKKSLK